MQYFHLTLTLVPHYLVKIKRLICHKNQELNKMHTIIILLIDITGPLSAATYPTILDIMWHDEPFPYQPCKGYYNNIFTAHQKKLSASALHQLITGEKYRKTSNTGWANKNRTFLEIPYFCSHYRYNHAVLLKCSEITGENNKQQFKINF